MVKARHTAVFVLAALGGLGALATPAFATFHLNKVNEVMLASGSGDAGVQFVELLDRGGNEEEFTPVFAPYRLVVYDAAGNKLGEHMVNPAGLRAAAAASRPYLISTAAADAAFGVTGDERLDIPLPLNAGQACWEANPNPPAFSCLTWGAITKKVPTNSQGTGSANGPVPPNGESDQRQADDTIVAAAPTPRAPNHGATTPGPSGPAAPAAPAFAGVSLARSTATVDRAGRAAVRLRCPAGTNGTCRGRLTLTAAGRQTVFGRAHFEIAAAKSATVRVKLSRAALRQLRRHRGLAARARVTAHDASGVSKTTITKFTLVARGRR